MMRNIKLKQSRELADSLDLYDNEKAYIVTIGGNVVGTLTCWNDGTKSYYDYANDEDYEIKNEYEIERAISLI